MSSNPGSSRPSQTKSSGHTAGKPHASHQGKPPHPADAAVASTAGLVSDAALAGFLHDQIQVAAAPVAIAQHMVNMLPVDEGGLGDFPWFWQVGTNFNAKTYNWINNRFSYDNTNGYIGGNNSALMTAYFNVLMATGYVLDARDADALNKAVLANGPVANTIISDYTTLVGPIPPPNTSLVQQLNYVTGQVLTWGTPGLTLGQLRSSTNPMALLPNIPIGADPVVNSLMTYLANTSSVANIQAAVVSANQQLAQTRANVVPQPPLTAATTGFMTTVGNGGATQIVPQINIAESTAVIQNNLLPAGGAGASFSATFSTSSLSSDTVQITAQGGARVSGSAGFFLRFNASASAQYNMFQFTSDLTTCDVSLTFNGVTTVTPSYVPYNVSTGTGWWNPDPIEEAANPMPDQNGYRFSPTPPYRFGVKQDFGALARLLISQQPVISLTYKTSKTAELKTFFQQQSSWGISFLGVGLGNASQSYYNAKVTQETSGSSITISMSPVGITSPVTLTDQLAYVVGAEIVWPGASRTQNFFGI